MQLRIDDEQKALDNEKNIFILQQSKSIKVLC